MKSKEGNKQGILTGRPESQGQASHMTNGQPRAQFPKGQLGHMRAAEGRESCQRERREVRSERWVQQDSVGFAGLGDEFRFF